MPKLTLVTATRGIVPSKTYLSLRVIEVTIGCLLIVGALLQVLLMIVNGLRVIAAAPGTWLDPQRTLRGTESLLLLAVAVHVGLALAEGRKCSVLLLRRFGFGGPDLDRAIRRALGRRYRLSYRLVTLDDLRFVPAEVPSFERWFSRLAGPIAAVAVFVISLMFAAYLLGPGEEASDMWLDTGAMIAVWTERAALACLLFLAHRLRIRRRSRRKIRNTRQLKKTLVSLESAIGFWWRPGYMAPQSTIVSCSGELWQTAVSQIGRGLRNIIVDLSEPSPNIAWEIECLRAKGCTLTYIAEEFKITAWSAGTQVAYDGPSVEEDVARLVGSDPVLLYSLSDKDRTSHFSSGIRNAIGACAVQNGRPRRSRVGWLPRTLPWLRSAGFYLLSMILADEIAGYLGQGAMYLFFSLTPRQ
jgi:hypothetical protein